MTRLLSILAVICLCVIAFAESSALPSKKIAKSSTVAKNHGPAAHVAKKAPAQKSMKQADDTVWTRHAILDKTTTSLIHLFWNFDDEQELLTFEIQAQLTGWVGVGFSPSGGMEGADIVTCWVKDGVPTLQDRHAKQEGLPALDASQDYTLISASENETHTICRFSRKYDTCDIEDDFLIGTDTVRVIYAYGLEDPKGDDPTYHGTNRGTTSIYLLDPPAGIVVPDPATTKAFEVRTPNATIEGMKDTTYICSIHRGPSVESKHRYIGYLPSVQPGNEVYVHHALFYQCYLETQEEIDTMETYVGTKAECYGSQMPSLWHRCTAIQIAWAVGSEGHMYQEDVGFPFPTAAEGPFYYMMEMHYNNPTFATFSDASGLVLYYSDEPKKFDMGMLEIGLAVSPFQMIPPNQKSFKTVSFCPAVCTENAFPEDGINVFAGLLHSHLLGRQMKLRLVRYDGFEEPWFQYDDHYDFDFQETRIFPETKKLYPGDYLILECTMGSEGRDVTTTGGWGTDDEMCLAFLNYYPQVGLTRCMTFYDYDLMQSLIGFPDLIQDVDNLQFLVDANTTFAQFLDKKFSPWEEQEVQLFRDIASGKYSPLSYCLNGQSELLTDVTVSGYPEMEEEYELPPRDCPAGQKHHHNGYEPMELTKSLQFAFPQLVASHGHLYKKIKK